ncbi:myeloid cell surface antigen CD33-like [Halichoeres trimaculatus]|uniref:myeloid cell surface antigen CD33-like n=1 Tax=Halichoeres trimaculatus TaxID=147232 RepID=UPI003D9F5760
MKRRKKRKNPFRAQITENRAEQEDKTKRGSPVTETKCQWPNFCITLREGVITAETGLCVVIPCSFTTDPAFKTTNIVWYKCDSPNIGCSYSNMIFNSKYPRLITNRGFKGRVSLLEPDVSERNCSIIINDLRKSDSGFYQLRVEGTINNAFCKINALCFVPSDLTQKPSVIIPPLTEGQQTTLSCTAPGLCSGSAPEFTWMWRGGGGGGAGNIQTQNLSAIKQQHSSTLTFTPSAEQHGTNVTCQVSFKNTISTEITETLIVSCK